MFAPLPQELFLFSQLKHVLGNPNFDSNLITDHSIAKTHPKQNWLFCSQIELVSNVSKCWMSLLLNKNSYMQNRTIKFYQMGEI